MAASLLDKSALWPDIDFSTVHSLPGLPNVGVLCRAEKGIEGRLLLFRCDANQKDVVQENLTQMVERGSLFSVSTRRGEGGDEQEGRGEAWGREVKILEGLQCFYAVHCMLA